MRPDNEIVLKELGALPKTLDEMYSRVLLAIDDDERLFVAHVLHWIYIRPTLWRNSITLSTLLQAADLSTRETPDHTQKYGYDEDTLREQCGCLITVTPREDFVGKECICVEFAHYTVVEYLESHRITASPASMFALRNETIVHKLPSAILREALHDSPEVSQHYREYEATGILLSENITFWCAATAILFLSSEPWQHRLSCQAHLRELVFELLRPSRPGYLSFSLIWKRILHSQMFGLISPIIPSHVIQSMALFSQIKWLSANGCEESVLLLSLLHFHHSPLAEALIRTKNSNVFLSKVSLRSRVSIKTVGTEQLYLSAGTYDLSGTIVEVAAQLGQCPDSVLSFLIKQGSGLFDPSKILYLYFGNWSADVMISDALAYPYAALNAGARLRLPTENKFR